MSPLLSSLSCLVLYLRRQQHSSFLSLTRSPHSAEAWRLLCHSSLSLLILYNRHRECEVAKLTIQDYRNRTTPQTSGSSSPTSGMESLLSPFERQVLCHLPRAGVLGKRGRVQPLIFPPHCESCLDLLLQTSPNVGVDPDSPYVFSRPYHSPATPLRGTDLLRNLARASGAKNPGALTATRVRRQVAILTQLLLLEEGESQGAATKRLEDFLEREYHVTQSCSSILRDPALMGRVGRVVLYGEREGVLFRGMSLQHICLELDGEMSHTSNCPQQKIFNYQQVFSFSHEMLIQCRLYFLNLFFNFNFQLLYLHIVGLFLLSLPATALEPQKQEKTINILIECLIAL